MDFQAFKNKIWLATATQHDDELKYIQEAFDTNWITTEGTNLVEIERQVSKKVGCKYAVALTNGTAALHLAVKLAGVKDGDTVCLGNTRIEVMETPGHTEGTISLFYQTEENGVIYNVGTFGGAGANTLVKERFDYDNCREDYFNSLKRLKEKKVDVFIGNHVWNNNTEDKAEILATTGENLFIDGKIWGEFLDFCEKRLCDIIAKE